MHPTDPHCHLPRFTPQDGTKISSDTALLVFQIQLMAKTKKNDCKIFAFEYLECVKKIKLTLCNYDWGKSKWLAVVEGKPAYTSYLVEGHGVSNP